VIRLIVAEFVNLSALRLFGCVEFLLNKTFLILFLLLASFSPLG
jgi:hypothetical protein